ncbi:hypothetical protein D623_10028991 [Myotis brandtii]|uniref:Uncharacterized protein n=1 Tax=Myotis brandtii TaxID=109478 RepID=S7P876_MYOBR|nr:hypothetical protein D623_10028991 [Myotis brandtii]
MVECRPVNQEVTVQFPVASLDWVCSYTGAGSREENGNPQAGGRSPFTLTSIVSLEGGQLQKHCEYQEAPSPVSTRTAVNSGGTIVLVLLVLHLEFTNI